MKLPGDDGIPGGIDHSESARITARLAEAGGFHYLVYCDGSHSNTLETHIPDMSYPRAPYVEGTRGDRGQRAWTFRSSRWDLITDPAEAEGILASGKAQTGGSGPAISDRRGVGQESRRRPAIRDPLLRIVQHLLGHDRRAQADPLRQQPPPVQAR